VYNKKDKMNIIGFLLVKSLIVVRLIGRSITPMMHLFILSQVNPSHCSSLRTVPLREPLVVSPNTGLLDMLRLFQAGKSHLALVSEQPVVALESLQKGSHPPPSAHYIGMVTMEDVLEKVIQEDISDEIDLERKMSKNMAARKMVSSMWSSQRNSNTQLDNNMLGSITVARPEIQLGSYSWSVPNEESSDDDDEGDGDWEADGAKKSDASLLV